MCIKRSPFIYRQAVCKCVAQIKVSAIEVLLELYSVSRSNASALHKPRLAQLNAPRALLSQQTQCNCVTQIKASATKVKFL